MKYSIPFALILLLLSCHKNKDTASSTDRSNKKKTLYAVHLKGIHVEAFPKYDAGGEDWDAYAPMATDPDIFLHIKWKDVDIYKSDTHNDTPFGTQLLINERLPVELKPFDQALSIEMFDEDGVSSNDNMAYFTLNLLSYKDWTQVPLTTPDGKNRLLLDLEWIYK